MKNPATYALCLLAVASLAGCRRTTPQLPPISEPQLEQTQAEPVRYRYDHQLRPDPNYDPSGNDALAAKLMGKPYPPRSERANDAAYEPPPPHEVNVTVRHVYPKYTQRDFRYDRSRRDQHYLRVLTPGTLSGAAAGAVVGSRSGKAGRGALVGAGVGRLLDGILYGY